MISMQVFWHHENTVYGSNLISILSSPVIELRMLSDEADISHLRSGNTNALPLVRILVNHLKTWKISIQALDSDTFIVTSVPQKPIVRRNLNLVFQSHDQFISEIVAPAILLIGRKVVNPR